MRSVPIVELNVDLYRRYMSLRKQYLELNRLNISSSVIGEINRLHLELFYPGLFDPERYPSIYRPAIYYAYLEEPLDEERRNALLGKIKVPHPILR